MSTSFTSLFRLIAALLVMTVLSSGITMAGYICPQLTNIAGQQQMMSGMPCAGMDKENPVQCAQYQSGAQLALEHMSETPSFVPSTVLVVIPEYWPITHVVPVPIHADISVDQGADPPYLRTLRLRI